MSPRVMQPSREELEARRQRLLRELGMTRIELEAAAEAGTLTGERFWVWEDIRSIEFLLGADNAER